MIKKIVNFFLYFFFNIKIIRILSHKSKIIILENLSKNLFYKISFSRSANNLLLNENEGYKWYSKVLKKKFNFKLSDNFFKRFEIEKFHGNLVDYHKSVIINKKNIYRVINYYKKNWPKKKIVSAHGDFTFANLVFGNDKSSIYIIDWENFKKSGEPWGFDLVYFFISIAILPNLKKNKLNIKEKKELMKIWKIINKLIKNKNIKKNPIKYFKKTFRSKSHWLRLNQIFPSKFFLNKTSKKLLNDLDQLVSKSD